MSETSVHEPVRYDLFFKTGLEVLRDASGPMKPRDVIPAVEARLAGELTEYETEPNKTNGEARWATGLSFGATDMTAAGWMTKNNPGWSITEAGVRALETHPEGRGLAIDASRAYREAAQARKNAPSYQRVLLAALDFLEAGEWTSYSDLAEVSGTNAQTVGAYMSTTEHEAAFRVLRNSGIPSEGFRWLDSSRTDTQREALEADGIDFVNGAASDAQRKRSEDFREFLEDAGVIAAPTQRAWFVKGLLGGSEANPRAWIDRGVVVLRDSRLPAAVDASSRSELKDLVEDAYAESSYAARAEKLDELHAFLSKMKPDDLVATSHEGQLYLGRIAGEARQERSERGQQLVREVDWHRISHPVGELDAELTSRFQVQHNIIDMTQQLDLLVPLLARDDAQASPPPPRTLNLPPATQELAERLHVSREWLQECIDLLADRPQLIFYGPPGTGKTFLAQHLAEHLGGDAVQLVQFHPSYSYEDFFEGYRPTESGGFALTPGPMRRIVERARKEPGTPHFLIIDEINRGNLAKIFGELYFLLEYRDRTVELLYARDSGEVGFSLPKNVFIIGTMNTADRSIALVDAAMRRRFAFLPLHPSEEPTASMLSKWLEANGHSQEAAVLLGELNDRIDDPDFKIGPSYFMRPAVHKPHGFDRVWRTAILPLLEEHHYGDGVDVVSQYGLEAIIRSAAVRHQDAAALDETDPDATADPA